MARKATKKEYTSWEDAIKEIMERDGVDEVAANQNFVNLLTDVQQKEDVAKWQEAVEQVVKDRKIEEPEAEQTVNQFLRDFSANQVEAWKEVIHIIMERDGVDEQAANDNFNNLLDHLAYEDAIARENGEIK